MGGSTQRQGQGLSASAAADAIFAFAMFWNDASTAITSLTLHSSIANGFKTGSYVTYEEIRT